MAYLHKGPSLKAGTAYNVEQAVGKTGANAPGDVKLVQYMLRNIYGPAASGLTVDGYIGPVTISWIDRFREGQARRSACRASRVALDRIAVCRLSRQVDTGCHPRKHR